MVTRRHGDRSFALGCTYDDAWFHGPAEKTIELLSLGTDDDSSLIAPVLLLIVNPVGVLPCE